MHPASAGTVGVDTASVAGRRRLRFDTIDQILTEVDRLVEADQAGRLTQLGNWTLGQTLGHLAVWSEYSYTDAPVKASALVRLLLKFQRRRFLNSPMRAGIRLPGLEGGTLGLAPMTTREALPRYRRALERLKVETPTARNVIFGSLTHPEWIALNLRHAELHLGFFIPR
jgi:hypothetical protein